MKKRIEHDALGKVAVPVDAYSGSLTERAKKNFQLSGFRAPEEFVRALGILKAAAANANAKLKVLTAKEARAIVHAAEEFAAGKFHEDYVLDAFQAGAGTPFRMNANEIIANRANELLGAPKGSYRFVTPNNHVNAGQSSNDVIPTAIRIAVLFAAPPLLEEFRKLESAFRKKGNAHKTLLKVGRTHLEDAVPITVGQEFNAWADMVQRSRKYVEGALKDMLELGIGGTALGSGITAHPKFQKTVVQELLRRTRLKFRATSHLMELTQSMSALLNFSAQLRLTAVNLVKIANDLKLLNMGPSAGIAELTLFEVEPGSSIMPGKVNPSIPEAVEMVCYQVMGFDHAIALGSKAGQLQLNVQTPMIMWNLLTGTKMLTNACSMFAELCVSKIEINQARITELYEKSLCTATALSPYLGYHKTAELVNEALKKGKTIREVAEQTGRFMATDLKKILSSDNTTKPAVRDEKIFRKIQNNKDYRAFEKKHRRATGLSRRNHR